MPLMIGEKEYVHPLSYAGVDELLRLRLCHTINAGHVFSRLLNRKCYVPTLFMPLW